MAEFAKAYKKVELKPIIDIDDEWVVIKNFPNYVINRKGKIFNTSTNKFLKYGINNGYYDVTIAPVLEVWNFGEKERSDVPSFTELQEALAKVDFTKVDILKFSDLENLNILYDHKTIINYAKQRLEWKLEYTNIAKEILPKHFKMSSLQKVYEIITGKAYDKRNFQKKIFSLNIISET